MPPKSLFDHGAFSQSTFDDDFSEMPIAVPSPGVSPAAVATGSVLESPLSPPETPSEYAEEEIVAEPESDEDAEPPLLQPVQQQAQAAQENSENGEVISLGVYHVRTQQPSPQHYDDDGEDSRVFPNASFGSRSSHVSVFSDDASFSSRGNPSCCHCGCVTTETKHEHVTADPLLQLHRAVAFLKNIDNMATMTIVEVMSTLVDLSTTVLVLPDPLLCAIEQSFRNLQSYVAANDALKLDRKTLGKVVFSARSWVDFQKMCTSHDFEEILYDQRIGLLVCAHEALAETSTSAQWAQLAALCDPLLKRLQAPNVDVDVEDDGDEPERKRACVGEEL